MPPRMLGPDVLRAIHGLFAAGFRSRGIAKQLRPAGIKLTRGEVDAALNHIMSGVPARPATANELGLVNANLWVISQGRWGMRPTASTSETGVSL